MVQFSYYNIDEENSIFINFIIGHSFIMFICKCITVEANSNISVDNYEQNYWACLSRYGMVFENNYYNKSAESNRPLCLCITIYLNKFIILFHRRTIKFNFIFLS